MTGAEFSCSECCGCAEDDDATPLLPLREVDCGRGSIPGTMAAGTGGGAGNGDIGSRVGNSGSLTSGKRLYRFSLGEIIFISRNFERSVETHSRIASLEDRHVLIVHE